MRLTEKLIFGTGKKEAGPIASHGWERIGIVLRENYLAMIGLNLLYVLCCIPIVTIPAATCGLYRVMLNWVREQHEGMITAFFREFKTDFWRRTGIGLLFLIFPLSLSFYPFLMGYPGGTLAVLGICLAVYFCVSHYFYPLLVMLDVPVLANLKNACILAIVSWRTTGKMILSAGVIDVAALIFTNQAAPLYIIFCCSLNCLLCCGFFIYPFEKFFEYQEVDTV